MGRTRLLEVDYLIVGAGASGMAFCDELLSHSDATIAIVDRRHAPGGHWVDAYPFVRLHQPSRFYGVGSDLLGRDSVDAVGFNAGFYELAGPEEICAYYDRIMRHRFLASERVRYFPQSDYVGERRFVSRLSGDSWEVDVTRKLVDTAYLEGTIPATSPPPFEVMDGARCVSVGELARIAEPPRRYVIVGAGKTGMDAIVWLLERGVPASAIQWIKPREAWWLNRKFQQPLHLLPDLAVGAARQLEAMATASSIADLFARLEAAELFLRVDPSVPATMFRGAIVSEAELELLRRVEDVVRLGHIQRIEPDAIVLDQGRVPTSPDTLHVHCAARALIKRPLRPVFEPGRVTMQLVRWGFTPLNAALLGYVEAVVESDEDKNRLCPPFENFDVEADFVRAFLGSMLGDHARSTHPQVREWLKTTRLNPASGLREHASNPQVQAARATVKRVGLEAAANLTRLLAASAGA